MVKFCLPVLIALGAAAVQAQPPALPAPLQPAVDSASEREAFREFTACLARARPGWARGTLSHPYLSHAQASIAAQALHGKDSCVMRPDYELRFRTSSMIGNLAEHFLRSDLPRVEPAGLARALSTLAPRNVSEDFALCVASRNPAAARDLAMSEPGSAEEQSAGAKLAAYIEPCTAPGEDLEVDLQALRALVSVALYRGVTTGLARS